MGHLNPMEESMSTIPASRGTNARSKFSLLVSFARQILWICVGALAARPLHAVAQPQAVRIRPTPQRMPSRLRDGT
jgi:hypothetical protein